MKEYFNNSAIYNSVIRGFDNILTSQQKLIVINSYETRNSLNSRSYNSQPVEATEFVNVKTQNKAALVQRININTDIDKLSEIGYNLEELNEFVINKKIESYIQQKRIALLADNNIQRTSLIDIA